MSIKGLTDDIKYYKEFLKEYMNQYNIKSTDKSFKFKDMTIVGGKRKE